MTDRTKLAARKIEIETLEIPKFVKLLEDYSEIGLPRAIDRVAEGDTEAIDLVERYHLNGIADVVDILADLRNEVVSIEAALK